MADASRWGEEFASTRYRFMRLSRATGLETEQLRVVRGGTISRNNDVRIVESAEVGLVGELDLGPDLVRVHMDVAFRDGSAASEVLGTFVPAVPSRDVAGAYSTATLRLYGRLQELYDDRFPAPVVLPPGTNAVEAAARVCRECGLEVIADESSYVTTDRRTYGLGMERQNSEVGDTKLDMVNDLLDLAGFWAAKTDPWGRVVMRRYVAPEHREPVWSFEEGPRAKFEGAMTDEHDVTDAANHVLVLYQTGERSLVGEAWDHETELSVESRGRVITRTYEYTSIPGGMSDAQLAEWANANALRRLRTAQATIRRVTLTHAYAPLSIGDAVLVDYPTGGVSGKFEVRTQTLTLSGGCPTEAELRQFNRRLKENG